MGYGKDCISEKAYLGKSICWLNMNQAMVIASAFTGLYTSQSDPWIASLVADLNDVYLFSSLPETKDCYSPPSTATLNPLEKRHD